MLLDDVLCKTGVALAAQHAVHCCIKNAYFLVRRLGAAVLWRSYDCAIAWPSPLLGMQEQEAQDPARPSPKRSADEVGAKPDCGGIRHCVFVGGPELADDQGALPGVSCVVPKSSVPKSDG